MEKDELLDRFIQERYSDIPMCPELREAISNTIGFSSYVACYHIDFLGDKIYSKLELALESAAIVFKKFTCILKKHGK